MKLTDEQLAQHHIIANRVWAGTRYHYPLIEKLVNELLAARKVVEAARTVVTTAQSSTHGDYSIVPSQAVNAVAESLTALDEAVAK